MLRHSMDWFSVSQVTVSVFSALVVGIPSFAQIGAASLGARPTHNIVSDIVAVLPSGDLSSQQIFRAPVFGKADALINSFTLSFAVSDKLRIID